MYSGSENGLVKVIAITLTEIKSHKEEITKYVLQSLMSARAGHQYLWSTLVAILKN